MNQITVTCRRASGSTHARIGVEKNYCILAFGTFTDGNFVANQGEAMLFADHPEVADLHDGDGWNLDVLNALVANYGCGDEA